MLGQMKNERQEGFEEKRVAEWPVGPRLAQLLAAQDLKPFNPTEDERRNDTEKGEFQPA